MESKTTKKGVAFYEGCSWYHRMKVLREDGSTLYTKRGGFSSAEEAEESYNRCQEEFEKMCRNRQAVKKDKNISLGNYLRYWLEKCSLRG